MPFCDFYLQVRINLLCKDKKNSDTYALYLKNSFIFASKFNSTLS
jgi:hypothetical protein